MSKLTVTENSATYHKAIWTMTATLGPNVTASGATFKLGTLNAIARYAEDKNVARMKAQLVAYAGSTSIGYVNVGYPNASALGDFVSWEPDVTKTLLKADDNLSGATISTSTLFSSSNSTAKSVDITLKSKLNNFQSTKKPLQGDYLNSYINANEVAMTGTLFTVTLNAPPTFTLGSMTFSTGGSTTNFAYAGYTTASVALSNLSAKYGGTITSAVLKIGNQTSSRTTNGTFSILLNSGGTFTPTVTVTDSRGQVTTQTLSPITVNVYTEPSVSYSLERTSSTGVPGDETTYAVASATLTFTDDIATLQAPTVAVTDQGGSAVTTSVTWYSSRASDGTLSGSVTWGSLSSGATVYALLSKTNGFDTQQSYVVSITPNDSKGTGTAIAMTLSTAFYTVDFLAGGHGIAFGQAATNTGFYCNMPAHFADANSVMRSLFDFIYPVGSYYETSQPQSVFDPNVSWGGTWILETEGQVHVSAGTNYAVSGANNNTSDGGVSTHTHTTGNFTLTTNEIPAHTHGSKTLSGVADFRGIGSNSTEIFGWYATSNPSGNIISRASKTWSGSHANFSASTSISSPSVATMTINATHEHTSVGSGNAHNHGATGSGSNMQPYINIYRWHRTA